ncbi:SUF system Fe-S cluster assembly regulator [Oceanobacter mangrovi]|uniref:SUF system Fe-S cluster assembly regulator n=1 Tax=Oceanobacter mangrovi TaxID=2862510 RepID=UPI001C8D4781|nr:SUF system Fe-S cluster assembly regulator [Oceanobacter mangrovi]
MKIGKLTDYGVLVLNHLARTGVNLQSTEEIATATGIPLPTARKVMRTLVDAGLVLARRGAKGGYRLGRSPAQIPLLAIVEAFEGKLTLTECSSTESDCEITEQCSLAGNWVGINQVLGMVLAGISLNDIRHPAGLQRLADSFKSSNEHIHLVSID